MKFDVERGELLRKGSLRRAFRSHMDTIVADGEFYGLPGANPGGASDARRDSNCETISPQLHR
jgi:hypothetical protein